jgi:hypothetical protein
MNNPASLLDELRVRYEALPGSTDDHGDVESFQAIDARLREAFRWLEPLLKDLVRLVLGRESAFLRRGRLAGLRGRPHDV